MRISDWSSDVCSSDLRLGKAVIHVHRVGHGGVDSGSTDRLDRLDGKLPRHIEPSRRTSDVCDGSRFNANAAGRHAVHVVPAIMVHRSEEHTSELQSLMRISYAVFCLKKKTERISS